MVCVLVSSALHQAAFSLEQSSPVALEDFARRPKLDRITFTNDGKKFAALEEYHGRMNVVVADLEKNSLFRVTGFEHIDVAAYRWISNKRLVLSLVDYQRGLAEQRGGGLFAINADGSDPKELSPTAQGCEDRLQICRYTQFVQSVPDSDEEIIAVSNDRSARSPDLYRLSTRTGKKTLLTLQNPGQVVFWALDKQLEPRAALSHDARELEYGFWFRDEAKTAWRKVLSCAEWDPCMKPLGFGPDGALYVSSSLQSGDRTAIYKFDPKTGQPGEKIAAHPLVDLDLIVDPRDPGLPASPLVFDPKTEQLLGLRVEGDKPEVVWFDEKRARLQRTIDLSLPPGNINTIRPISNTKALILSRSGSDPGIYYLYDEERRQLRELARPRSWIRPEQMGVTQVVRYKARDGTEIPAYLTLPPGKPAKELPLVVWVHGGPWARDEYRWDPDVQFMASRGYAILQPNYRGSVGFGRKHMVAGFKQLGQAMQDDITDGVKFLIGQGVVDSAKVCIGGGSYGGYATMMGLIREPEMFKCGINVVGVTDLNWWLDLGYTDFNLIDATAASAWLKRTVGDPAIDKAMMEANSPRLHAQRIHAPVLFIHGGGDMRVPIKHAEAMRDALAGYNKPYEWVVFPEEGHGFMKETNRVEMYRRMESFLKKYLGP